MNYSGERLNVSALMMSVVPPTTLVTKSIHGHGRIEIERAGDLVRRYAGSLPAGSYPDGYLDELRGEWRE